MNKTILLITSNTVISVAFSLTIATTFAANISYSVVSLATGTCSMGIIIDDHIYPLLVSDKSPLLHTTVAPIAKEYYKYTMLEDGAAINAENFSRLPIETDTVNEYYNRSWNKWELKELPVILDPLPVINRVDTDLHVHGQIPTVHFVGDQTEIDNMYKNQTSDTIKVKVNMTYISLDKVKTIENVRLKLSGHSSRMNAKLSYKIKIHKHDSLYGYRRLKFKAICGSDFTYMREYLACDMYNSIGLPTSKFSYVRLYINNEAIGLFGLSEAFSKPWISNEFADGDKNFKHGALYSADNNRGLPFEIRDHSTVAVRRENNSHTVLWGGGSLSYLGNNLSLYSLGYYSVKEKPSEGEANFTRIMDLTKFIHESANTTTDNSVIPFWEEKMDTESFLRGTAMEILISNFDGYFGLANNYLLYDDLQNERLLFSGNDFDSSMGFARSPIYFTGNYTEYPYFTIRPLTKMLNVPKFKERFEELLLQITLKLINPNILSPRIDQVAEMLSTDVEWDQSLPRKGIFSWGNILESVFKKENTSNSHSGNRPPETSPKEYVELLRNGVPFDKAVYGPIDPKYTAVIPLKKWVQIRSRNILEFFDQTI